MHELYATQAILDKAIQKAQESNAKRVTNLYLAVGEISTYTEVSFQFYWDNISKGTLADGAKLHFRRVQAEVQCMNCFTKYHPVDAGIVCPNCKSVGAKIIAGEEFFLESIDVE